jgi:hypothetical protein
MHYNVNFVIKRCKKRLRGSLTLLTMLTMSATQPIKPKDTRTTLNLPPELGTEVSALAAETGVSLNDLCRQGLVRMILEKRDTGSVRLLPLPALTAA